MAEEILTDEEIAEAFEGSNFGDRDKRKLLEQGVLKRTADYRTGHTLHCIMKMLGLITEKGNTTKKGRRFLFWSFYDSNQTG